jgi:hypothetical protein
VALRLCVVAAGPDSIVVSGAVVSALPYVMTSCGRSVVLSRLRNCCSASEFSEASRIRKPWLAPDPYMARTWEVTVHSRLPAPEATVASGPVVGGWLLHVTPPSVQLPVTRMACKVRVPAVEAA